MVWVKYSDDFMLDERVQVIDCCADSALRAAYEVCNRTETDGVFYLDQLMTRWSPVKGNRRRLRKAIEDLIGVGLVHRLEHAEALRYYTMAVENGHQFGLQPVKNRHYFQIVDYLETQPSADEKRAKREKNRQYVAKHRQQQKDAGVSTLRKTTPDPDPEPFKINDHAMASKEPASTADPSTPSIGTADRDAVSELRRTLEARWPNAKQREHFDEIQRLTEQEPGDPVATLAVAFDAFDADTSQQKYRHSPKGLVMHWNTYVADHREQTKAAGKKRRADAAERRHQEAKQRAEEQHAREVDERARQQNGSKDGRGGAPVALAELMRSIEPKVD